MTWIGESASAQSGLLYYTSDGSPGSLVGNPGDVIIFSGGAPHSFPQASLTGVTASAAWDSLSGEVDYIPFNTGAGTPSNTEGYLFYDYDEHALAMYNDASDVTHQLGREFITRVFNNTGTTISDGTAVYISGASLGETRPEVGLALATSKSASSVVGISTHDIPNNTYGYVTSMGIVNNIDLSSFSEGDILYLDDSTPGSYRTTSPEGSYKVLIGYVIDASVSGKLYVSINPDLSLTAGDAEKVSVPSLKGTGGTISVGQAVRITGYNNGQGRITIETADASDSSTMPAFGIASDTITSSVEGNVVVVGRVANINTSSFSVGDNLYVSETAGALTNTKPTGTALIQKIAICTRSHASQGVVKVFGAGRSNDIPNLAQNKVWMGNANGVPTETSVSGLDTGAFHKAVSAEFANLTSTTVANGDLLVVEDISNSFNKRRVTAQSVANLANPTGLLRQDASRQLITNWDAGNYQIRASGFYSDVPDGTPPLRVDSSTYVANLNGQYISGWSSTALRQFSNGIGFVLVSQGGTGAASAAQAKDNLGLTLNSLSPARLSADYNDPYAETSDATGLYYAPINGFYMGMIDGAEAVTQVEIDSFTNICTSGVDLDGDPIVGDTNYDIFANNDNGSVRLGMKAWASDSGRDVEIIRQADCGVIVMSGTVDPYIGTVRTVDSGTGVKFVDENRRRFVWNYHNRKTRYNLTGASSPVQYNQGSSSAVRTLNNADYDSFRHEFVVGIKDYYKSNLMIVIFFTGPGTAYFFSALDGQEAPIEENNRTYTQTAGYNNLYSTRVGHVDAGYHYWQAYELDGSSSSIVFDNYSKFMSEGEW